MKFKDRDVVRLVKKWKKTLGLLAWDLTVQVNHDKTKVPVAERNQQANCDIPDGYLRANLVFNMYNIDDIKDLNETIVHELVHIILRPLEALAGCYGSGRYGTIACAARETAVTHIAKALVRK